MIVGKSARPRPRPRPRLIICIYTKGNLNPWLKKKKNKSLPVWYLRAMPCHVSIEKMPRRENCCPLTHSLAKKIRCKKAPMRCRAVRLFSVQSEAVAVSFPCYRINQINLVDGNPGPLREIIALLVEIGLDVLDRSVRWLWVVVVGVFVSRLAAEEGGLPLFGGEGVEGGEGGRGGRHGVFIVGGVRVGFVEEVGWGARGGAGEDEVLGVFVFVFFFFFGVDVDVHLRWQVRLLCLDGSGRRGHAAEGRGGVVAFFFIIVIGRVGFVVRAVFLFVVFGDGGQRVGPLDVLGFVGGRGLGGGALDGLVEPAFLLAFGVGQVEHEAVEEVGVADQQAEVVVGAAGFLGQLGPGRVGEVVGLREAHLLLLLDGRLGG